MGSCKTCGKEMPQSAPYCSEECWKKDTGGGKPKKRKQPKRKSKGGKKTTKHRIKTSGKDVKTYRRGHDPKPEDMRYYYANRKMQPKTGDVVTPVEDCYEYKEGEEYEVTMLIHYPGRIVLPGFEHGQHTPFPNRFKLVKRAGE